MYNTFYQKFALKRTLPQFQLKHYEKTNTMLKGYK